MTCRIGINATPLNHRASGARQRFEGLYGALFRLRPDQEFLIYEPSDCRISDWFADFPNVRGIRTPLPSGSRWKRWATGLSYWRGQLAGDRLDLFEALHLPLIRAPACPTILTVHDARPVLAGVPLLQRTLYRRVLRQALRDADAVVTVSDAMKRELAAIEPRAKLTTIYNGIDSSAFRSPAHRATSKDRANFILAVGHFEPRKNYRALVAAMTHLRTTGPDLHLQIVGHDGGLLEETRAQVEALGLGDRVTLRTDVDDAALHHLYRSARALVFPSLYEGFGIPLLEAMAAGLPMAVSDLAVFRELTEDQAAYFPPHDPAAIARVIGDLLGSPERQQAMIAYGFGRVGDFSFDVVARQLDALHRQVRLAKPLGETDPRRQAGDRS